MKPTSESLAWFAAGIAAQGELDFDGAVRLYRRALDVDPGNVPALVNLALIEASLIEDFERAVHLLRDAAAALVAGSSSGHDRSPTDPSALLDDPNWYRVYYGIAAQLTHQALALKPTTAEARLKKQELLMSAHSNAIQVARGAACRILNDGSEQNRGSSDVLAFLKETMLPASALLLAGIRLLHRPEAPPPDVPLRRERERRPRVPRKPLRGRPKAPKGLSENASAGGRYVGERGAAGSDGDSKVGTVVRVADTVVDEDNKTGRALARYVLGEALEPDKLAELADRNGLSYRGRYNLACYWSEAARLLPVEERGLALENAHNALHDSVRAVYGRRRSDLVRWARKDPSLEQLMEHQEHGPRTRRMLDQHSDPAETVSNAEAKGLARLEAVGERWAARLKKSGVNSPSELAFRTRTQGGRDALARDIDASEELIRQWAGLVELLEVNGIEYATANLLGAAGVGGLAALAQADVPRLARRLREVNDARSLTRRVPSERLLRRWAREAEVSLADF